MCFQNAIRLHCPDPFHSQTTPCLSLLCCRSIAQRPKHRHCTNYLRKYRVCNPFVNRFVDVSPKYLIPCVEGDGMRLAMPSFWSFWGSITSTAFDARTVADDNSPRIHFACNNRNEQPSRQMPNIYFTAT